MSPITLISSSGTRIPMEQNEQAVTAHGFLDCPAPVSLNDQMRWIPKPDRPEALRLQESMIRALSDRDGRWAATCLRLAASRLSAQEQSIATWIPLVAGAKLLEKKRQPLHHLADALTVLCRQIRDTLAGTTPDKSTIWIVPATGTALDRAAAYLAAGCLSERGRDARPWLWAAKPSVGICVSCGCAPQAHAEMPTLSVLPVPGMRQIWQLPSTAMLN